MQLDSILMFVLETTLNAFPPPASFVLENNFERYDSISNFLFMRSRSDIARAVRRTGSDFDLIL